MTVTRDRDRDRDRVLRSMRGGFIFRSRGPVTLVVTVLSVRLRLS